MTILARRYRFSASHRLHASDLSAIENARLYGKCNNPFGHGHDYVLEVSVTGPVDAYTGLIVPVSKLDRLVEEQILRLFASRNLNLDVPQFANVVPTTENIALVVMDLLQRHWDDYLAGTNAQLYRVHIQETDRNNFEVLAGARGKDRLPRIQETESVIANA